MELRALLVSLAVLALQSACDPSTTSGTSDSPNTSYERHSPAPIEPAGGQGGLTLQLTSNRESYSLADAPTRESIEAALAKEYGTPPPPPTVEMTLRIANNGAEPAAMRIGGDESSIRLSLDGPGALHLRYIGPQTTEIRLGKPVSIAPGATHDIAIGQLSHGGRGGDRAYWTAAGKYQLQAVLSAQGTTAPSYRLVAPVLTVTVTE